MTVVATTGGVWFGSAAIGGFLVQPLSGVTRLAAAAVAVLMILPVNAFDGAPWLVLAGVVSGGLMVARETRRAARSRPLKA